MITKTQLKEICLNNPFGFTINLKGEMIKKGFVCSFTNRINKLNLEDNINDLFNMLNNSFQNVEKIFIGGWLNNGFYELSLNLIFKSEKKALIQAKLFNQKAIYSLRQQKEIVNKHYKEFVRCLK